MNDNLENLLFNILVAFIVFLGFIFSTQWIQNDLNQKHLNSLMSYCEKITGKSQASFNSDGTFIGCETVIK